MEFLELKTVFDAGGLISAVICRAPLGVGYILIVKSKAKKDIIMSSQRDESPRVFKTVDAAARNAEKIGFKTMTINLT